MAPDSSAQDHGSGEINIAAQNSQKPTGRQWPLAKIDACSASEIEIDPARRGAGAEDCAPAPLGLAVSRSGRRAQLGGPGKTC
jgi:hypothetical protein